MVNPFVIEPIAYTAFADEAEQVAKCKEWGLLSAKAAKSKTFMYKGYGRNEACEIVGYVDDMTAVIEFAGGQKHCIHPAYLKEMQAASFGRRQTAAADTGEEAEGAAPEEDELRGGRDATEAGDQPEAAGHAEAGAAPEAIGRPKAGAAPEAPAEPGPAAPDGEAAPAAASNKPAPAVAQAKPVPARLADEPQLPDAKPAKPPRSAKVQLPEEKVRLVATVKEFTTVPNHFSDNDDEVVVYERVSILEPALELGDAWSSHSATVKKWELNVGDTITFEAKVIAKKLTKHPVKYKINNPGKMQKEGS